MPISIRQELLEHKLGRPDDYESRLFRVNWQFREVLFGLAVLLGWRLLMVNRSWWPESIPESAMFFFSAGFPALWMICYPILVARQRGVQELFGNLTTRRLAKEALITLPVAMLLMAVVAVASNAFVHWGGKPLGAPQETAARGDVMALLLLSVTLTPLAEELFFRGFLYNFFRRKSPIWVAIAAQAMIFAIMHAYSPIRMTAVFCMGVAFGLLYQWRKTLVAPVIMHAAFNLLAAGATVLVILVQLSLPYLGVQRDPEASGYLVQAVAENSPAAVAGVVPGDRIVKVDGVEADADEGIAPILVNYTAGQTIELEIERDGQHFRVQTTLERRPRE